MKMKLLFAVCGTALMLWTTGCVDTVSGRQTGGFPLVKDQVEGRYERSVEQAFNAAVEVVRFNGALISEGTLHSETNAVRTVEGKVNQRSVFIRVEPVDQKITSVKVQTRTTGGGGDLDLAHEIEKQIALKLAVGK